MSDAIDLGPLPTGEPAFRARMRAHQAWYRAAVLSAPYGVGPRSGSTSLLGSMLDATAAAEGHNFLTPEIHTVAEERIAQAGGVVEPFRCRHNLLSSQPMCFNLFGPLVVDGELATRLLDAVLPGGVARVVEVVIEWAPGPAEDYLDDRTAFDAFVAYERPDGTAGFVGVETKLTEPFSTVEYESPRYREVTERADSPWRPERYGDVADTRWNQLWRQHMLVEAVRRHPDTPYGVGSPVVVHHPSDPDVAAAIEGYRGCLKNPDDLLVWPLDELVRKWRAQAALTEEQRAWLDAFALRYLELDRSEKAWQDARELGS